MAKKQTTAPQRVHKLPQWVGALPPLIRFADAPAERNGPLPESANTLEQLYRNRESNGMDDVFVVVPGAGGGVRRFIDPAAYFRAIRAQAAKYRAAA